MRFDQFALQCANFISIHLCTTCVYAWTHKYMPTCIDISIHKLNSLYNNDNLCGVTIHTRCMLSMLKLTFS